MSEEKNRISVLDYVYQYKDHLGNIRLSYSDSDGNNDVTSSEIIEENNYYPFGLKHKGYNNVVNGIDNNYKDFQGQELTEDLGLNVHEWRYRISDPAIGRFWQVDPLAEDYEWMTVYQFSSNQPIHAPELEGLESMRDLNTHDPGLESINATSAERVQVAKTSGVAFATGAAVAADVYFTGGQVTKHLAQQAVLQTTFNGIDQLASGQDLDFTQAASDAIGDADLFDAGFDTMMKKVVPGGALIDKVMDVAAPSMVDVTLDGGIEIGGVNKDLGDVSTDVTFSIVADKLKDVINTDIPNMKFSANNLIKNTKDAAIDYGSDKAKQNIPSVSTRPRVGRRVRSERNNTRVQDNTSVRRNVPKF